MAEPHPTDKLLAVLIARFAKAEEYLTLRLIGAITRGKSTGFVYTQLAAVQKVLTELAEVAREWANENLSKAALMAVERTEKALAAQGIAVQAAPGLLPRDAIYIATQNLIGSLDEALRYAGGQVQGWGRVANVLADAGSDGFVPVIGRRVQDELRRIGLEATARKLTEGMTVKDMRRQLAADLAQNGIMVVQDQAGRRWNLRAYSEMVARTITREVYTQGTIMTMQRHGQDLLQASEHWPTCEICATRQGRVYSISGNDPDFPPLSKVGPTPWHANCGHVLTPRVRSYTSPEELERLKALSNRPFNVDPRSKAEVEAYQRAQRINALRRERQQLLLLRNADAIPMDRVMQRWAEEMRTASPERRKELEAKLAERMERWEEGRKARLKEVNAELKRLAAEQRQAFKQR